jgi:prophage regulatory protein
MNKETVLTFPHSSGHMAVDSILRLPQVVAKTGLSRSTLYVLQKHNEFPKAIQLGGRAVGWLNSEVSQWLAERAAARKEAA